MDPGPERSAPSPGTFPCPCCGYLVHEDGPGSFGICPICRWEDDMTQLLLPTYDGGANHVSLLAAQQRYLAAAVPAPPGFAREPGWRPLDPAHDAIPEPDLSRPWPADRTTLYWWRSGR